MQDTEAIKGELENIKENSGNTSAQVEGTGEEAGEQYVICPCCGKPTLKKPLNINGELLDRFLACVISGEPFTNTYKLYGGRVQIDTTMLDSISVMRTAVLEQHIREYASEFSGQIDAELSIFLPLLRIYNSIRSIVVSSDGSSRVIPVSEVLAGMISRMDDKVRDRKAENAEDCRRLLSDAISYLQGKDGIGVLPINVIGNIVSTHNSLYNILMDSGFDKNFWDGIELA